MEQTKNLEKAFNNSCLFSFLFATLQELMEEENITHKLTGVKKTKGNAEAILDFKANLVSKCSFTLDLLSFKTILASTLK